MIKKTIKFLDIENTANGFEDVEKEETLRFVFTLPAVKLYEQRTGHLFFEDYQFVFNHFYSLVKGIDVSNVENLALEEQMALMPIMTDANINTFDEYNSLPLH
jgi:hypothetical protein